MTIAIGFEEHLQITVDKNQIELTFGCEHGELYATALLDHVAHSFRLLNCSILSLDCCVHVELDHVQVQLVPARCHRPVLYSKTILFCKYQNQQHQHLIKLHFLPFSQS